MIANELLMQFQADVLGPARSSRRRSPRPARSGAAYAAGLAVGFWSGSMRCVRWIRTARRWEPAMDEATRAAGIARWHKGIERSLDWVD